MDTFSDNRLLSPELRELASALREAAQATADEDAWPAAQLEICKKRGVFRWFIGRDSGGDAWSDADLVRGYLALSMGCLTTAFILTQRTGAVQRIERSGNEALKRELLPGLLDGRLFATLGISHLTTSRRHLAKPVLAASEQGDTLVLDGYSPWVTGAAHADFLVAGATLDDGREVLLAVPTTLPGVETPPPERLVGLTGSHTGRAVFEQTRVEKRFFLAGPVEGVMKQGVGARTGGLQTSTLALGLARSAIDYLQQEARQREPLGSPAAALHDEWDGTVHDLLASAESTPTCSDAELRRRANSLVLRATQAALTAAKGTGYVHGHPAGRWCREALFFLVWSCPQPVAAANLCEFAGIEWEP